jgi:hypothetical protein
MSRAERNSARVLEKHFKSRCADIMPLANHGVSCSPTRSARRRSRQLKKQTTNTLQLSLVVSCSDATAALPGYTVTGSISIGR